MTNRVGVIGGGQLAWMMAGAAETLGIELSIQTPSSSDPAVAIAAHTILAPVDDALATAQLASHCDLITFENEFVDLEALHPLILQGVCFRPSLATLAPLLDKYHQRCYLRDLGLPTPKFTVDLDEALTWGFPLVLKARRHGYDGQGTFILRDRDALVSLYNKLGQNALLFEEFVPFERELAVIAARSPSGEVVTYPVVETQQEQQVCRRVLAPADLPPTVQAHAAAIAQTLLSRLDAVGIFGIELFLDPNSNLLVNEIAPRTHNSGHFTLDACSTSQFEQHLRAIFGLPLGETQLNCSGAVMINLLGYESGSVEEEPFKTIYAAKRQRLAQLPDAFLHWYGKSLLRPGRKLGHVTVLLKTQDVTHLRTEALAMAETVESIWYLKTDS